MPAMRPVGRTAPLLVATTMFLSAAAGCIVIPHPRDVAVAGGRQTKKPRLAFLKVGSTTRDDVLRIIGPFDSDASDGPFLWARWQQVKVQVEWFAASYGGAAGGSDRVWKIVNLLALFDEQGQLTTLRVCSEGDLMECLCRVRVQMPPGVPTPQALLVAANHESRFHHAQGRVIVEDGRLAFEERKDARHNFSVPLSEMLAPTLHHGSSAEFLHLRLHFRPEA